MVENNQFSFFYQANILTSNIKKKKKSLKYEQKGLAKPGVSVLSEITFTFGAREPGRQTWEKKVSSDLPIMNMVVNA